jgi:hypothetical protein
VRHRTSGRPRGASADPSSRAHDRERLRQLLRTVLCGQYVYSAPASTAAPIRGRVVEVSNLALAIKTETDQIVWVHGEDCPDLIATARR